MIYNPIFTGAALVAGMTKVLYYESVDVIEICITAGVSSIRHTLIHINKCIYVCLMGTAV
jgi:hypothetical protein